MRYHLLVVAATFIALLISPRAATPAERTTNPPTRAESGPTPGAMIPSFFVRAVTGPHRNRSVCYVCRYGSRPVVMVLMQQVDPNVARLLKAIDEIVDENRVVGLRSFGVLVTDDSSTVVPIIQTLAFDEQIRTPLAAATTAIAGTGSNNLHREAATTIVLYRHQKAVHSLAFERGQLEPESIDQVAEAIARLLKGDSKSNVAAQLEQ